jgi:TolB-like protein/Flp pilus assembly protein TadD
MKKATRTSARAKQYPPRSFMGKLKKRQIIGTLVAFISGGWFLYEIVHWILVDHYHLPERLKDIVIVCVVCAMLCALILRWFRGEKKRRKIKFEFVLIPPFVLLAIFINANFLLHFRENATEPYGEIFNKSAWKNSVAVLPFVNISGDMEQEYFCDGLTEEMITRLSQIRELKVPARTSAFVFKGEGADIQEVGQRLRVENVLEGSVRRSGSRIRISAQLINVADGYHLWSETYDRDLSDIFAVQEEIARSVAGTLQVTLLGNEEASLETGNIEAYNSFLLGRYFYGRQTRESLEKAVNYFEQALTLDPGYARAWAGLGSTYAFQAGSGYVHPKKGYAQAREAVKKALALDKNLAYAHAVMGWIQMSGDWDWAGADASYQKAISLEPNRGLGEAAQLAVAQGRFDQGLALARRAAELNPISAQAFSTLGFAFWYGGRLDEAIAAYRKILELIPGYPAIQGLIGLVYLTQSNPQMALAELEPVKDPYWRLPGLAMAYYSLGRKAESDAALAEFIERYQAVGAYNVAQAYAFRGEADLAFQWLERAYDQHDGGMFLVMVDPLLKNLKTDPRYKVVLKKMRLQV